MENTRPSSDESAPKRTKTEEKVKRKYNPNAKKINTVTVPQGFSGMPDEFRIKLAYVDSGQLTGAVEPNPVVYRATSINRPNYTAGGNHVRYYAEMAAIYSKYLVLGIDWEVTLTNAASVASHAVVAFNTVNSISPSVESYQEMKHSVPFIVGAISSDTSVITKRGYMSYAKVMGQKYMDADPTRYAAIGSSPTDGYFMFVRVKSCDGTTTANVYWKIKLVYYVILKDVIEPISTS